MGIKNYLILLVILAMFMSGCASSMSTIRATNSDIQTRYYNASYDKVINAAVEAANKMDGWKVQDVDDSLGLITVGETTMWRYYVIRILVKKTKTGQVSVDVSSKHSTDIGSLNKKYIKGFLDKLDELLGQH
ncbi:MAG: hypothetical protein DRP85_00015 [Candidatus Makaraimicrobium thalassicum]|nr:MAG: hypothetical protein DRP85_00015 [Candidatus Omnitrophota bacterium]